MEDLKKKLRTTLISAFSSLFGTGVVLYKLFFLGFKELEAISSHPMAKSVLIFLIVTTSALLTIILFLKAYVQHRTIKIRQRVETIKQSKEVA